MKALTLLKRVGTDPGKPVLLITAEEAMEKLLEAIKFGDYKRFDTKI
ncbi:MAG: hypothetical protein KGJ87_05355 [Planctomycetota bacterium]|nr:hypothetical protein [Planctomycetota bacterium]MDE2216576.1 hypothetical protein [Planctomycetota bacterium]